MTQYQHVAWGTCCEVLTRVVIFAHSKLKTHQGKEVVTNLPGLRITEGLDVPRCMDSAEPHKTVTSPDFRGMGKTQSLAEFPRPIRAALRDADTCKRGAHLGRARADGMCLCLLL